jgi:hypothetical protein
MSDSVSTILSPHLDDAVLSCWHVLSGPGEVAVVNVFAGSPSADSDPGWWDRMTGAADSAGRVRERVVEDREALGLAGREPVNLSFLDEQYRNGRPPGALVDEIEPQLAAGTRIYAPAGLVRAGSDHALVMAAALDLRRSGYRVSLYADLPHAVEFGWPSWVTGTTQRLAVEAGWEEILTRAGVPVERLEPAVHELDPPTRERKLEAIRVYRTQLPALEAMFRGLDESERLRYELTWELGED